MRKSKSKITVTKPTFKPMEIPKGLYAVSNYLDKPQDVATLSNASISGVFVRVRWATIEPTNGSYNWSLINTEIDNAKKYNKKIILSISAGENTPLWLKELGVPFDMFDWSNHQGEGTDKQLELPIPYNETFIARYNQMISALSTHLKSTSRYDQVIELVMTGVTLATAETRQPYQGNSVATWIKHGYTKTKIVDAWYQIAEGCKAAFSDKCLGMCVIGDPVGFPSIDENGAQCLDRYNDTAMQILNKAIANYKNQLIIQFNAVTNVGGTPLDFVAEQGVIVAYQEQITTNSDQYLVDMAQNVINHKGVFLEIFNKTIKTYPTGTTNAAKLFV